MTVNQSGVFQELWWGAKRPMATLIRRDEVSQTGRNMRMTVEGGGNMRVVYLHHLPITV